MRRDLRHAVLFAIAVMVLSPSAAMAHAELSGADPKRGAQLPELPQQVSLDFTEPPTGDAQVTVLDGCARDVTEQVDVQQLTITVSVGDAQPGRWKVDFAVVSGLDGHATRGSYRFVVAGSPECAQPDPSPTDEEGNTGGSSLPVILALGGLVLFGAVAIGAVMKRK